MNILNFFQVGLFLYLIGLMTVNGVGMSFGEDQRKNDKLLPASTA